MMNSAKEKTESKRCGDSLRHQQEGQKERNDVWLLKRFTRFKEIILNELGFEEYLQKHTPSVCINFESGRICGDEEEVQRAIDAFECSFYMHPITFTAMPGIQRLFHNEEGSIQETVALSIKAVLFNNKIKKYSFQCHHNVKEDDTLSAMVYCMSRDEAALAKNIIESHICSFTLKDFSNEVKKVINKWKMKQKLVQTELNDGGFTITCTSDVKQEIQNEENKTIKKSFPMSSLRMKYLAKRKDIIKSASKSFNTQIELDPGKYSIKLEGSFSNIKAAMNNITARMVTETASIPPCPSKYLISELDSITDEQHCMWEIKNDTNHHLIYDVQDCDHIETWFDPTKNGTFTIIEGDSIDINVDCLIVLCTDNLFPVQFKPDAEMLDPLTSHIGKTGGAYRIGEVLMNEDVGKRYTMEAFVVVGKSNTADKNENKNFKGLAACFKRVFKEIIKRKATSVCIPAYIQEEFLSKEIVLKAYLEATINLQKSGDALKIYLYCEREKEVLNQALLDTIKRTYEKELGFSRIVYKQDLEMTDWSDQPDLQVAVEIKLIEKMRTDVIVNTTSTKLDLNKGIVSKRLLELAGRKMQEYCTAQYPDGIDFTTVAVTDAYGLKEVNKYINYVFHGALPSYRRDKYIQAVKTFMRCCLSEADKRKCKSIAFPALGTGNLGYPIRQVAKAMFDAVEEYGKEAVCPYVQRVVFSLYEGDTAVCQVFRLEEQDRIKNRSIEKVEYRKDHNEKSPTGNRHLRGEICGFMHPVEIIVGIRNSNEIPSTCLEIKIFSSDDIDLKLKYRNESPQSINDYVIVSGGSKDKGLSAAKFITGEHEDERAYKRAIKDAVQYCLKYNIAEIAVDLHEGPRSIDVETKLNDIAATIVKCLPTQTVTQSGFFVLHTVYVNIQDADQYENIEKKILKQGPLQTMKNLLNSVNLIGSNVKWEVINTSSEDTPIKVQIIGDTKESVQRAKQKVKESIKSTQSRGEENRYSEIDANWYNNNQGARPKNSEQQLRSDSSRHPDEEISGRGFQREKRQDTYKKQVIKGRIFQDSEKQGNGNYKSVDENPKVEVFEVEVSADINEGFILFKQKFNDFQRWKSLVENVYNVQLGEELLHDDNSVFKVRGKYQQVMKFEVYLDEIFPLDPEDITRENLLKSKVTDSSHNMEEITKVTKQFSNEGAINPIDDYYKTEETIVLPGTPTLTRNEKLNIPSGHVSVKINKCEIQDITADYLIVPYSRHYHKLSEQVVVALGDDIRKELNHSVSMLGFFQSCECRVTCAGRLDSCKIIHMCLDEDQNARQVTGKLLQNALKKALWMSRNATTVAILLTGISDESNFNYVHVEQFFDSICGFSKESQGVNVAEIDLISHIEDYVTCAAQNFAKIAERNGIKFIKDVSLYQFPKHEDSKGDEQLPQVDLSSKTIPDHFSIGSNKVTLMIAKGDVSAVIAKGVVCIQDIDLSCSGETAHKIHMLCGEDYRKSIEESRTKYWDSGDILALPTKGGSIFSQFVINVILPACKEGDYDSFSTKLHKITNEILQKADGLNLTYLAMPFLQPGEEDQSTDICFIRACSRGMATGIMKFFNDNRQCCFERLEILVKDEGILEELKKEFKTHLQNETIIW